MTPDYSALTDSELAAEAALIASNIRDMEAVLSARRADMQAVEDEQERRELEAMWKANPGARLEVGDSVLITDEFRAFKFRQTHDNYTSYLNQDASITAIWCDPPEVYILNADFGTSCPIELARRMRQAYLDNTPDK